MQVLEEAMGGGQEKHLLASSSPGPEPSKVPMNRIEPTGRMGGAVYRLLALWVPRNDWNQPSKSFCCCVLPL